MTLLLALILAFLTPAAGAPTEVNVATYHLVGTSCGPNRVTKEGAAVLVRDWSRCQGKIDCSDRLLLTSHHVIHQCREVLVEPLICDGEGPSDSWTTRAGTPVSVWPLYDLAAIPVPADRALDAVAVDVGFAVKPELQAVIELYTLRPLHNCPLVRGTVVETVTLRQEAEYLVSAGEYSRKDAIVNPSTGAVKIILHEQVRAVPGSSGGGLWDPTRQQIIGIHQAGFQNDQVGWAIQLPARDKLGAAARQAVLGVNASWPDLMHKVALLQSFESKEYPETPQHTVGAMLGLDIGWAPMFNPRLARVSLGSLAVTPRFHTELHAFGSLKQHSVGLSFAGIYRYAEHPVVYLAPTGTQVDSTARILHSGFLEFGPQLRLFRHARFGASLMAGGRAGLDFPDARGRAEGLYIKGRVGAPVVRVDGRLLVTSTTSMVFSAVYATEFFGSPSRFEFQGVFPETEIMTIKDTLAAHVFGVAVGVEFKAVIRDEKK